MPHIAIAISKYENNISTPSAMVIANMASIFRVSANYLLGIEEFGVIRTETLSAEQRQIIELLSNDFGDQIIKTLGAVIKYLNIINKTP